MAYSNDLGHLLIFIIFHPRDAGAFSRDFTTNLVRLCRAFSGALKIGKLKAPLFPGPLGPWIQMTGALHLRERQEKNEQKRKRHEKKKTMHMVKIEKKISFSGGRTGAVVSVADYGPRGPWFETWPRHSLLWP